MYRILFIFFFYFLASFTFTDFVHAQTLITGQKYFERVKTIKDIDDGIYLITGTINHELYALSSEKNKDKLKGIKSTVKDVSYIINPLDNCIWQLKKKDNTFIIINDKTHQVLSLGKKSTTSLATTSEVGDRCEWAISPFESHFYICNIARNSRSIGINTLGDGTIVFGNYEIISSPNSNTYVDIYKMVQIDHQDAILPEGKDSCAIGTKSLILNQHLLPINITPLLLSDQTIAKEGIATWKVTPRGEHCFTLTNPQNKFLNYDLKCQTDSCLWQIIDKRIASCEKDPRFLGFYHSKFILSTKEYEKKNPLLTKVGFHKVASSPTSQIEKGQILHLYGGWSSSQLSQLKLDSLLVLNCQDITLPVYPTAFQNIKNGSNLFILIDNDNELYSQIWPNIIFNNRAISAIKLSDKNPISDLINFEYMKDSISYSRTLIGDGEWETLCIPFNAKVPHYIYAESLTSINNNELKFEPTEEIKANIPVIIKPLHKENAKLVLTTNEDGFFSTNSSLSSNFTGTYSQQTVKNNNYLMYFLNRNGKEFVRAGIGSTLFPFRAFITLPKTTNPEEGIKILHTSPSQHNDFYFDLQGRKYNHIPNELIYINNQKKIHK